jgi:hypothetical protein
VVVEIRMPPVVEFWHHQAKNFPLRRGACLLDAFFVLHR